MRSQETTAKERPRQRFITEPPRLTIRQTQRANDSRARTSASRLLVGHLNVRSLTKHLDDVNLLLQSHKLDVLCLSETWMTQTVSNSILMFRGYTVARKDRTGRTGGGVAIIYRDNLTAELLSVDGTGSSLESLWMQLTGRRQIVIGAIYRPPGEPPLPAIDDLHDQLLHVMARGKPVYMLGDTNFDVLRPAKPGVAAYIQLLHNLSLSQLIDTPILTRHKIQHLLTTLSPVTQTLPPMPL